MGRLRIIVAALLFVSGTFWNVSYARGVQSRVRRNQEEYVSENDGSQYEEDSGELSKEEDLVSGGFQAGVLPDNNGKNIVEKTGNDIKLPEVVKSEVNPVIVKVEVEAKDAQVKNLATTEPTKPTSQTTIHESTQKLPQAASEAVERIPETDKSEVKRELESSSTGLMESEIRLEATITEPRDIGNDRNSVPHMDALLKQSTDSIPVANLQYIDSEPTQPPPQGELEDEEVDEESPEMYDNNLDTEQKTREDVERSNHESPETEPTSSIKAESGDPSISTITLPLSVFEESILDTQDNTLESGDVGLDPQIDVEGSLSKRRSLLFSSSEQKIPVNEDDSLKNVDIQTSAVEKRSLEEDVDPCSHPVVTGSCNGSLPRFYFSTEVRLCIPFTYTGCGQNSNNFGTQEDCLKTCDPHRNSRKTEDTSKPKKKVEFGSSASGTGIYSRNRVRRKFPLAFCSLELDVGVICPNLKRGLYLEQFFFDTRVHQCTSFVYSGCGGNANRFSSMWECTQNCVTTGNGLLPTS